MSRQYVELNDADVALLVRDGDSDAFVELAARYIPFIKWRSSGFFTQEQEDLWQEGLLGLLNAAKTYSSGNVPFCAYAKTCIVNRFISSARKNAAEASAVTVPLEDETAFLSREETDPEKVFMQREYYRLLRQNVFCMLSVLERKVFFLFFEGYRYAEIADMLSVSEKAVDNAMQRVRKKLKRIL